MKKVLLALALGIAFIAPQTRAASEEVWNKVIEELLRVILPAPREAHRLEKHEATEQDDMITIARIMFEKQMAVYLQSLANSPATTIARRDAHAKGHVCAAAEVSIEANLPAWAQRGIFSRAVKFDALVRFSNGAGVLAADTVKDGRGLAIKLIDSAQAPLAENVLQTGKTHDFLLVNNERFFAAGIRDYLSFQKSTRTALDVRPFLVARMIREALGEEFDNALIDRAIPLIGALQGGNNAAAGEVVALLGRENAGKVFARLAAAQQGTLPVEVAIFSELGRESESSLAESYFSMASYLLKSSDPSGDEALDQAVKYKAEPMSCPGNSPMAGAVDRTQPDFLRADLLGKLAASDQCFGLFVQALPEVSLEEKRRFVEDSRLRYGTEFVKVATVKIPRQDVSSAEKAEYCEHLSFNPWQAQAANIPLGAMNRSRLVAVTASSIRRHLLNQKPRQEPVSSAAFRNLP